MFPLRVARAKREIRQMRKNEDCMARTQMSADHFSLRVIKLTQAITEMVIVMVSGTGGAAGTIPSNLKFIHSTPSMTL
jgi:hypothetical protein